MARISNAPRTFQRCMMAIFSDMVEKSIEILMHDFSMIGSSFDECLENIVLKWEKCHFMGREGIFLRHRISEKGIEVDRAKIEVIEKLPPVTSVKGVSSFLGYSGFYKRFFRDFSKISRPYLLFSCKEYLFIFMIHA